MQTCCRVYGLGPISEILTPQRHPRSLLMLEQDNVFVSNKHGRLQFLYLFVPSNALT